MFRFLCLQETEVSPGWRSFHFTMRDGPCHETGESKVLQIKQLIQAVIELVEARDFLRGEDDTRHKGVS